MITNLRDIVVGDTKFCVRPGTSDTWAVETVVEGREYLDYLEERCDPADRWLDIGAHIGTFSVTMSPLVGKIVAYEPDPNNAELLRKNLELNGTTNVEVVVGAVVGPEERAGNVEVFYVKNGQYTVSHSLTPMPRSSAIHVTIFSIENEIARAGANKLKIDAEGAEKEIIYAISDKTWSTIDEVIFEYHPKLVKDYGGLIYESLLVFLRDRFSIVTAQPLPPNAWRRKTENVIVHCAK